MNTLQNNPELMTRICNIQAMKGKINPDYDQFADFKNLEKLTEDKLWELQNSLIIEYNKTLKN